jgi:hypothetical protein
MPLSVGDQAASPISTAVHLRLQESFAKYVWSETEILGGESRAFNVSHFSPKSRDAVIFHSEILGDCLLISNESTASIAVAFIPLSVSFWIIPLCNQFLSRLRPLCFVFRADIFRDLQFPPLLMFKGICFNRDWSLPSISTGLGSTLFHNRFGTNIASLKSCRYPLGSQLALISDHPLASLKPPWRHVSLNTNHLICHCRISTVNPLWFQWDRWSEFVMPSPSMRIYEKVLWRNLCRFLNRMVFHGMFAKMNWM